MSGWTAVPVGADQQSEGVVAIAPDVALKGDGTLWRVGTGHIMTLAGVAAIDDGIVLKADGTVWDVRQNDLPGGYEWVQVSGLNGVVSVAGHRRVWPNDHSLALQSDGTVWAWGSNRWGQLGNGGSIFSKVPRTVRNLSGVVSVAAGGVHSHALEQDGTVWYWGCEWLTEDGDGDYLAQCGSSTR